MNITLQISLIPVFIIYIYIYIYIYIILNTHFSKGYCKDSYYTLNIIEKLEGTGRTERNTIDFAAKPLRKARETYWMREL